jgi:alkylated DNA repair dioxygenase AlkB
MKSLDQLDLLGFEDLSSVPLPPGVRYAAEVLSAAEEKAAAAAVAMLDLKPFAYRGFLGNRRTASFGWRYDFNGGGFQKGHPIPAALLPFREIAAEFAGIPSESLEQLLAIEYSPRAGIGWHRDRPQFGVVVALSLLAPCRMRFRRKVGERWDRRDQVLAPRSAYLLDGPGRTEWEHSIPSVDVLRYSLTFRTLSSLGADASRRPKGSRKG